MLPRNLIIHHSGSMTSPNNRQFNTINNLHKKSFNMKSSLGLYMGYHAFIEVDGTLIEARADTDIGAHTLGRNGDSLGVCLAGDFDNQMPSDEQIATLKRYLLDKMKKWTIPAKNILPHRYFATYSVQTGKYIKNTTKWATWDGCMPYKSCPGNNLGDNWGQLLVAAPPSTVAIEEVEKAISILDRIKTLLVNYLNQRKALGLPPHERNEAE